MTCLTVSRGKCLTYSERRKGTILFTLRESPPAHSEALPVRADGTWKEETHIAKQRGQGEGGRRALSHLGGYLGTSEAFLELWGSLGGSWGPLGALLGRIGAIFGVFLFFLGGMGGSRAVRASQMAPRGPPMFQDSLQDGSRLRKIARDGFRHASKRPQEGHNTVPSALGYPSGPPRDDQILQTPKEYQ